ncbi:hypothetical protein R1sor_021768 [Riccia sorocarpa]|uniref:DUF7869 domain-containing protein n=1 Tax=Riccia sorocarpa TaxID=122646 RepID=A0ABD3GHY7_9MARC
MSGRTVYYSHRELSTSSPSLYLSFIHDAMDFAKTIIPRLCDKVKTLMRSVQPLPLKVIGILNHGHEPGVVAHVTSKEEFFQMEGADNSELQASTRMLPPNLYIQLDNSAKDNKNWAMMAFCSELVARGCCKMITMSFLVVGHSHEDVDVFFSNVNAAEAGKDIESLPHFLAVVYHAQSSKAYPREAEEELRARDEIFVGAASARKLANFVPMIDIANGLMLLIRPSDDFECQDCLWVGKATGAVCQVGADTNFNKVVQ